MKPTIKKILLGIFIFAIVILGFLHILAKPAPPHPFFEQFDEYPLVIAHAGSELFPTDTMYALKKYAGMGVDILEMDVNMTQDGHIVLIHDRTIDRTTDGTGKVSEMTLTEIQQYDAGFHWTNDDGETYPFRNQGINIPTLEDVFETFPDYPMIIEIKQVDPPMEKALCDLIKEYGMEKQVMVPSFKDEVLIEFRKNCPEVATAAGSDEVRDFVYKTFALFAGTISPEYHALQVPETREGITIVTKLLIFFANWRNVEVHIWTINDPADMQRFIDMGVHGILTDRTDLLLEILDR